MRDAARRQRRRLTARRAAPTPKNNSSAGSIRKSNSMATPVRGIPGDWAAAPLDAGEASICTGALIGGADSGVRVAGTTFAAGGLGVLVGSTDVAVCGSAVAVGIGGL